MTARQRAERLAKLYALRAQIEEEIHGIEQAMVNEAELIRKAREACEKRPAIASCGTDSGYYRHLRKMKEPACPACLAAHALATRARKEKRDEDAA